MAVRSRSRAAHWAALASVALVVLACSGSGATSTGPSAEATGSGSSTAAASDAGTSGFDNLTPWTFPVENVVDGKNVDAEYTPIDKVSKSWKICVLFPHMKDSYWLAADYGVVIESQRDRVNMQMFEAGGYTNLATQLNQMDNCISQGYDAIVIGAISADGVASLVEKATAKGMPVIDFVNGVNSPAVSAHALVSFYDLAVTTAKYIIDHSNGQPVNVGFFPGPQGAGWSDDAVRGFNETVQGTNVKVVATRRGDTGANIQQGLIDNALQSNPEINWIVGVDIAAQAAVVSVKNAGLTGKVNVMAFDIIPPVYDAIVAGTAVGSPTDFTVIQGRMAIDMAVRLLEKQTLAAKRSGPKPVMVTKDTLSQVKWDDMFAPKDFKATFTVNP